MTPPVLVRTLAAPLEAALRQAQADFLAQPAPAAPEEWLLPSGRHVVAAALAVGAAGRSLRITGPGGPAAGARSARASAEAACALVFSAGELRVVGDDLAITRVGVEVTGSGAAIALQATSSAAASSLRIVGGSLTARGARGAALDVIVRDAASAAGVDLDGGTVELAGARVLHLGGPGGAGRVGARITATVSASASDVEVRAVTGPRAVGVEMSAPSVRLSGIQVSDVTETGGAADPPATTGVDGLHAAGVIVEASEHVEATSLAVLRVSGASPAGIRIVCGAEGPAGAEGTRGLFLIDARAAAITGTTSAIGVLLGAARRLRLRGFTVSAITAPRAAGVLAVFARDVDASVGRIEGVIGSGGEAAGARFLGGASATGAVVHDLAVEAIGSHRLGGAVTDALPAAEPRGLAPPATWEAWGRQALDTIGLGANVLAVRWGTGGYQPDRRGSAGDAGLPPLPVSAWIAGLHVGATADDLDPAADSGAPAALHVEDCALRRIGGAALAIEGGLRPVRLRGTETWAAARGGWVQSEELLAAELTLDTLGTGLGLGLGEARIYDTIVSRLDAGPSFPLDPDAIIGGAAAVFTTIDPDDSRLLPLGPVPYVAPGTRVPAAAWADGEIPEPDAIDLRLAPSSDLTGRAVRVPGDPPGQAAFVGAIEPVDQPPCDVRDPEPRPPVRRAASGASSPLTEYTARDAPALLALMIDRAAAVIPEWTEGGPADFTTALLELLAERLDHSAYAQERTVPEGFLDAAVLRRSVEDLARPLDCTPDPGLSATAMLRFRLDLTAGPTPSPKDARFTVPAGTLVGNRAPDERSIVFATEAPLVVVPDLDRLSLAADAKQGDTWARLVGPGSLAELAVGRWLVFAVDGDPHHTGHVVRITGLERAAEITEVRWDPRRPLPCDFAAPGSAAARDGAAKIAAIYANVVPAHHGVPLRALSVDETMESDRLLGPYRHLMTLTVDGESARDVPLPLAPVSVLANGYPLPDEPPRRGVPALRVAVEGDAYALVGDLSVAGPCDEVVALRSGDDGSVLRFGRDGNGADLPPREVRIELDMRVGLGRDGNVGVDRLARLLRLGPTGEPSPVDVKTWLGGLPDAELDPRGLERDERLRALLQVSNPLPAVEGREAEPLDHLRYRAPLGVMDPLSAITAADYERLLLAMGEVGAASARVIDTGVRPRVHVTVLLRDEDQLVDDERLRRWAAVRRRLEEIRLLGFDVEAAPPRWVPLDLDVVVDAAAHAGAGALHDAVIDAVTGEGGLLDPDVAGLGGDVHLSSLYQAVLAVPGVAGARVKRFRRLEPGAIERLDEGIIPIAAHEVAVLRAPARTGIAGLFTVTVCGGLQ